VYVVVSRFGHDRQRRHSYFAFLRERLLLVSSPTSNSIHPNPRIRRHGSASSALSSLLYCCCYLPPLLPVLLSYQRPRGSHVSCMWYTGSLVATELSLQQSPTFTRPERGGYNLDNQFGVVVVSPPVSCFLRGVESS
jgi:hypothetical protein